MAALEYSFRVVGENLVNRAFTSIEARARQHNAFVRRQFPGTPVNRPASSVTSVVAARSRASGADMAARSEAKAAAQAERYWQRAHQRSADYRMRIEERAHRARLRQVQQEESAQKRAAASLDRQRSRGLMTQFRADERHRASAAKGRAGAVLGAASVAGRSVGGTFGALGRTAALGVGVGGAFAVGNAIQTQMAESAKASQLANQAGRPQIKGELLREAQRVQGFTGMESLEGLGAFVDVTGDLESARKMLTSMSQVALATSTNLTDLAGAMGTAFIPLQDAIADPAKRLEALNRVMRATAGMGAVGAVEVKDLASEMAGLAATSSKFAGDAQRNLDVMVAMAQATRQRGGASSAAEAVTSVERFASDAIGKSKDIKKLGVDVFERDAAGVASKLKSPDKLMADLISATQGDLGKISSIFGERSIRAVQGFSPLYAAAEAENAKLSPEQRKARGVAGSAAVAAEMKRLTSATVTEPQIAERVASRLEEPDLKFKEAMKEFNRAVGAELLPVITRLIPEFTKLIPTLATGAKLLASLVDAVAKDPVGSIFKLVGAKLLLDLATAGIGSAVKNKLLALLGAGGGAGGVAPVPGGGGGKFLGRPALGAALGAAGIGAVIGAPIAAAIEGTGIARFEAGEQNIAAGGQELNRIRALSGSSSSSEFTAARDALDSLEERRRKASKTDVFDDVMGLFGASNKKVEAKSLNTMVEEAQAKIRESEAEARRLNVESAKQAGEAFKSVVETARPPLNRTNGPTADPTRS